MVDLAGISSTLYFVDDHIKIHRLLADRDGIEAAIVVPIPVEKEPA